MAFLSASSSSMWSRPVVDTHSCRRLLSRSVRSHRIRVPIDCAGEMAFLSASSSVWSRPVVHTHSSRRLLSRSVRSLSIKNPCFPSLMLPPSLKDDTSSIDFNFYSLADNRVVTQQLEEGGLKDLMPSPIHYLNLCGSSHGWIAMCNPETLALFIYDPISLRHIKLPGIHSLPNPTNHRREVHKLILSCSPDEDEQSCRAVVIYNRRQLAFCCPGHSNEWTPFGNTFLVEVPFMGLDMRGYYTDIVYSSRQNLLFAHNSSAKLETWDLSDPSSPRFIKMIKSMTLTKRPPFSIDFFSWTSYLVVADDLFSDYVLSVSRYCSRIDVDPDAYSVDDDDRDSNYSVQYNDPDYNCSLMTIGFYVSLYDQKEDEPRAGLPRLPSLSDVALFIGNCSDSVALSTTLFPQLRPNSVYFTDKDSSNSICSTHKDMKTGDPLEEFGGHDIGIFDFENKTFSCYYPCDRPNIKRINPSPIWFFPRLASS